MTAPHQPPPIPPVASGVHRPLWSVMIPTYNCADYLRQTLASVLSQAPGPDLMQIEVVDDLSTKDDPESVVQELGQGRVTFHRHPHNLGATGNFNACVERSTGHWVHILHGDDWVLPGFYDEMQRLITQQPQAALLASRNFCVDEQGIIFWVSPRVQALETGGHDASAYYYSTATQFCGTVIARHFYESHGGFLPTLVHTADCEMWSRAIAAQGGIVSPKVLANYRVFAGNDTGRLTQTAGNIQDIIRLNGVLTDRHPDFDIWRGRMRAANLAKEQAEKFEKLGNPEAAEANWQMWKQLAPAPQRLKTALRTWLRPT